MRRGLRRGRARGDGRRDGDERELPRVDEEDDRDRDDRQRVLDEEEIKRYVASGEPMGKAGAYAIQGRSGAWTQHMDGSYSGIMGLPLFDTAELLKPLGWHF